MPLTRMSGQWGKLSWRRRCVGGRRVEARERVLALDAVVGQAPAAAGADHERRRAPASAPSRNRSRDGRRASRAAADGLAAISSSVSRSLLRGQVDEPEAAGDEHDRLLLARRAGAPRSASASRLGPSATVPSTERLRVARASDAPAHAGLLARVGEHRADVAPGLVDRGRRVHVALRERLVHDLLERLARSAGGTARPASGRGRRARRGGRGAAPARPRAPAARAGGRGWRSTARASGSRIPEWWATSS